MLRREDVLQILGALAPGGIFMVPVRRSGGIKLSGRAELMGSSDFARQLLYSAGFEDIQAVQLTALQGFSQTLPGDCCVPKPAMHSQTEQGTSSSQ